MANAYLALKQKQQQEVDNFPFMFAFSNKQFEEGMAKLGLEASDTDKIYSIGGGGYVRKTDSQAMGEMFERHAREMKEAIKSDTTGDGFIFEMFNYELGNHEYVITGDTGDTLDALGLTLEEVNASEKLKNGLRKAMNAQHEWLEKHG